MRTRATIGASLGASLLALGISGIAPATAQPIYASPPPGYHPMPGPAVVPPGLAPGHVIAIVRSAGLTPLTRPSRRGPRYVILATDRYGQQLRVVIDAHGGRILRMVPAHDPRFAGIHVRPPVVVPLNPQGSPLPPPELKDSHGAAVGGPLVTPPGAVPNSRLAAIPPGTTPPPRSAVRSEPQRPARTPLPRARPALAAQAATPEVAAPPPPPPVSETAPPTAAAPAKPAETAKEPAKPAAPNLVPVAPLE
jgi:hypothetical protein